MMAKRTISHIVKSAAIVIFIAISSQANATMIVNGGFDGFTGNTNSHNQYVPSGWTAASSSPDVFDGDTNFINYTWGSSSNGGNFLHAFGFEINESAAQIIDIEGFVVDQQYEISFEQSISSNSDESPKSGGYWQIELGDDTLLYSDIMDMPDLGVAYTWETQSLEFTAKSTTLSLTISAMCIDSNFRTDLGIDGLSITTDAVPEPATLLLFGTGLAGLAGYRRTKKKA